MKSKALKEIPLLIISILPVSYLIYIWNTLPEKVPMHYNLQGEVNRYGSKSELVFISLFLPFLMYGIFSLVPYIDPKKQIQKMGSKYQSFKFILTTFMAALAILAIQSAKTGSFGNSGGYIVALLGALYVVMGNYFKAVRPNYFIGIRTPWTLENEEVWKATHRMGGWLWFFTGLGLIVCGLTLGTKISFTIFSISTVIIVAVPIIYSYIKHRELESVKDGDSSS